MIPFFIVFGPTFIIVLIILHCIFNWSSKIFSYRLGWLALKILLGEWICKRILQIEF